MKFKPLNFRVIALILSIFILATATYFAPEKNDQVKLTSTYPATVCYTDISVTICASTYFFH